MIFVDSNLLLKEIKKYIKGYYASSDFDEGGGYASYARLFIDYFIPDDVNRVLYIDCDTLIINDIGSLFEMDMKNNPIAMSMDCTNQKYKKVIGLQSTDRYFNSGVLVIDTKKWKEFCCFKIIMNDVMKGISYIFADQDFLNRCLQGHVTKFPFSYNYCTYFFLYKSAKIIKFIYGLNDFNLFCDDYNLSKTQPAILHFNGNTLIRPWFSNSIHPYKKEYDEYYFNSPWKEEKQGYFNVDKVTKCQIIMFKYLPKPIFYLLQKILQNIMYRIYYNV